MDTQGGRFRAVIRDVAVARKPCRIYFAAKRKLNAQLTVRAAKIGRFRYGATRRWPRAFFVGSSGLRVNRPHTKAAARAKKN
jgi:hypothetical protein